MQVSRIDVENVGPYRAASVELPRAGLVLVVGPNNAGKSALLRVFDMLAHDGVVPVQPRAGADGPAAVTFTFVLSEGDRLRVLNRKLVEETDRLSMLQLVFQERPGSGGALVTRVEVATGEGDTRPLAQIRWKAGPMATAWNDGELWCVRNWPAIFDGSEPVQWELGQATRGPITGELQGLQGTGVVQPLRPLLEDWRKGFFHFDPNRIGTKERRPIRGDSALQASGQNLPEALLYIFSRAMPAWTAIRSVMDDLVPDVGTLVVPVEQGEVWVAFEDPHLGVQHNLKALGTGVEQVLMTAYAGERTDQGSTIIVEEPESHLHPEGQRRLLGHLLRWGTERLLVASTHSTVFLDRAVDRQLPVWLVTRTKGISTVRQASTDLPDVLRSIGVRLSDVLSAERILLTEGDSDVDVLRIWFGRKLGAEGIHLVASRRGGFGAWHVEAFREWLQTADVLQRRVCFLRDRDELDNATINRLEASQAVRVLGRREIENYLTDPVGIRLVLERSLSDGEAPGPEEITQAMMQVADALKHVVVLKRVAGGLPRILPMDYPTIDRLAANEPTLDALIEAVEQRLPSFDWGDEIRRRWVAEEHAVAAAWSSECLALAPGQELLDAAFRLAGLRYRKGRDALRLAEVTTPPAELVAIIDDVVGLLSATD